MYRISIIDYELPLFLISWVSNRFATDNKGIIYCCNESLLYMYIRDRRRRGKISMYVYIYGHKLMNGLSAHAQIRKWGIYLIHFRNEVTKIKFSD